MYGIGKNTIKRKGSGVSSEEEEKVGGLAKTLHFGNFSTDIGPHRFFSQTPYLYEMIEGLLGDRWRKVNRLTRFFIKGRYFLYPINFKNVFLNLGIFRGIKIMLDFIKQFFINKVKDKELRSFEDIAITQFGRSLAELNMLNYTEKIWGLPCHLISSAWFLQRIKGLSIKSIINDMFFKKLTEGGPKTLVDQFHYPESGTALIYESIVKKVSSQPENDIVKTSSVPKRIKHDGNKIVEVLIDKGGKESSYKPKYLISSIPWNELLQTFDPSPPKEVINAEKHLRFRSHITVFITLNKPQVFKDQWLYFPEKNIPFGRIMEPKNFSEKLSPEDKTSLTVEYFCWENDKIWNLSKKGLVNLTIRWLEKLDFITKDEVIDYYIHRELYAYPVYDLFYPKYRDRVKAYLGQFDNLQLIGRAGNFKYNNQDHALEMGIIAARNIVEDNEYDLEKIGSENKYFERGYVHTSQ